MKRNPDTMEVCDMRRRWLALPVVLVVGASVAVDAQPCEEGPWPGRGGKKCPGMAEGFDLPGGWMTPMLLRDPAVRSELKLTPEQERKVLEILDGQEKARVQKRAEIRTIHIDYRAELAKETVDLRKARELAEKAAAATAEMVRAGMVANAELHAVLNAEQRRRLESLRAEHRRRMVREFRRSRN